MVSINTFSISKLNNAEFTGFFLNLQKAMSDVDAALLGVQQLLPSYNTTLQKLIDQVYTTTGSEFTQAMLDADVKRDQTYKRIRLRLQMVDVAEDNAAIKAVKDVVKSHLLAKYTAKVPQLPYQEESAILKGFILDIRSKLGEEGIAALGLNEDLNALELVNTAFIDAYNARVSARAEGDRGLTVKIRGEMTAIYMQICFSVQFLANSTSTAEADAGKAEACQAFIAVLNVLLDDARRRYNQRIAAGDNGEDTSDPQDTTNSEDSQGGGSSTGDGGSTDSEDSSDNGNSQGSGSSSGNGSTDSQGSGSQGGNGSTDSEDSSDNGNSQGGNGSTDPNKPSGSGVADGENVSF